MLLPLAPDRAEVMPATCLQCACDLVYLIRQWANRVKLYVHDTGKDEYHKTAGAEARKILQGWEFPGPKTGAKPVSPYWFARS